MKAELLNEKYPWTAHPYIAGFAEQFSDEEWEALDQSILKEKIATEKLKDTAIAALLAAVRYYSRRAEVQKLIQDKKLSLVSFFDQYITMLILIVNNAQFSPSESSTPSTPTPGPRTVSTEESAGNRLLRKYIGEYKNPLHALPTDPILLKKDFECALRNAAYQDNIDDLKVLITLVGDINAKAPRTGKTALHRAVEAAMREGSTHQCFKLLAAHEDIEFNIVDDNGKRALQYWDFSRFPDEELSSIEQQSMLETNDKPESENPSETETQEDSDSDDDFASEDEKDFGSSRRWCTIV